MPAIPFPASSHPGVKPQEGGGRLFNCYAEKTGEAAKFPVVWRRCAGLQQLVDIADHSHLRGAIYVGSTLIPVFDTRAYTVTESGGVYTATNQGALAGTKPVTIAKNNAATPNIVCVDVDNGASNLFTGSAPTAFADADLPQPNSVSELHGYFLWTIGDGRIFASGLNAVTVATNSFTTEQSLGGLLRGVTFRDEFFAFGPRGAGVYRDIGASPFPLERQPYVIKRGIAGTHAIAGWEPGWSNELIWVGDDGIVYRLNGYTPEPISNEDVSRDVQQAIRDGLGSSLFAFVHMEGKHAFWTLSNPGEWTHQFDLTTGNWIERKSLGDDDWRASASVYAFDRWILGDQDSGKLFDATSNYYFEGNSDALVMELISGVPATFPARGAVLRADFDFTVGVGQADGLIPIQTDPAVLISWSKDGGYSWSNPVRRSLGKQGKSKTRVTVRPGAFSGQGIRFKLSISDPVHIGFMGGQMAIEQRAA
jgi:hypothetical protein